MRILVMTERHLLHVLRMFPRATGRAELYSGFVGGVGDVADPCGGDLDEYYQCADQLAAMAQGLLKRIRPR